jgi:hypothetical protein
MSDPRRWNHNTHYHRLVLAAVLPGARWRRHLYWRWSLVWTRPAVTGA